MATHDSTLHQHAADFRKTAEALGHNVEDLGSLTKELAGDAVGKLQENAARYYDQGMKKAGRVEKRLEKSIHDNPLVSLLIAAGIGLVAGTYLHRR